MCCGKPEVLTRRVLCGGGQGMAKKGVCLIIGIALLGGLVVGCPTNGPMDTSYHPIVGEWKVRTKAYGLVWNDYVDCAFFSDDTCRRIGPYGHVFWGNYTVVSSTKVETQFDVGPLHFTEHIEVVGDRLTGTYESNAARGPEPLEGYRVPPKAALGFYDDAAAFWEKKVGVLSPNE